MMLLTCGMENLELILKIIASEIEHSGNTEETIYGKRNASEQATSEMVPAKKVPCWAVINFFPDLPEGENEHNLES